MDLMNDGSTAYEAGYGGNYNSLGVGGDGDEREDNNDEEKGSKRLPWTEEDNIRLVTSSLMLSTIFILTCPLQLFIM